MYILDMRTTHIYVLIDPRTDEIRYVGKANNVSQRYKAHLNRARKHQVHKTNWIQALAKENLKPVIQVIDTVPIDDWIFWESYWISQFKTWGFNLLNYTHGGEGTTFGNQTSFSKGNTPWNTGKGHTEKCEICGSSFNVHPASSQKRKTCSHECSKRLKTKQSIPTKFSKGHSVWNKNLQGYKIGGLKTSMPVIQYALDGTFVQEFAGCKEAALSMQCNPENIRRVCIGKNKTAKNFIWKYKHETQH